MDKGSSGSWVSCGQACDSANTGAAALNNSRMTYEFSISFLDVWGTNSPATNEPAAGFAIVAYDSSGDDTYYWGANNVNENTPNTWGLLEIPEFSEVAPLIVIIALILVVGSRGRRRQIRAGRPS